MTKNRTDDITIRRATPQDATAIIRFIHQTDTESRFMTREPGEFSVTLEEEQALLSAQGSERAWFVAIAGDDIVGMVNLNRVHTRLRLRHRATLGLVVLHAFQGQGIGRRLLETMLAWAQGEDIEQIELAVVTNNERAKRLYTHLGFTETGRLPHAFKYKNGTYADEIHMVLPLRQHGIHS